MVKKVYGEKVIQHLIYDLEKAITNKTDGSSIVRLLSKKAKELVGNHHVKVVWYEKKKPNQQRTTIEKDAIEYEKILMREGIINEE